MVATRAIQPLRGLQQVSTTSMGLPTHKIRPERGGKGVRWERPTNQNLGKEFDRPRVHTIQTILLVVEILGHTFRVPLLARHSHVGDLCQVDLSPNQKGQKVLSLKKHVQAKKTRKYLEGEKNTFSAKRAGRPSNRFHRKT